MFKDLDEIYLLFKKVKLPKNIILHVEKVKEIAISIADMIIENNKNLIIDKNLIIQGALLHDIGRAKTHNIFHAIEGVNILLEHGYKNEKLLKIIENHIGAGISKKDAKILGLPIKDYIPRTLEEKIVSQADNLTFGNKRITIKDRVEYLNKKKLYKASKEVEILHNELTKLAKINIDLI